MNHGEPSKHEVALVSAFLGGYTSGHKRAYRQAAFALFKGAREAPLSENESRHVLRLYGKLFNKWAKVFK
jgi:hypothetical protein